MRSLVFAFTCSLLALGCGSSSSPPDNAAWETRQGFRALGGNQQGGDEIDTTGRSLAFSGFDWTGVRHDLAINPQKKPTGTCNCLAVAVGAPNGGQFAWRGARPDVNPNNLAVAISGGADCVGGPASEADRRPSISAVDRIGKDIVVEVEDLPLDRPIASGAILSPLEPGGKIYVKPRSKKVVYAKTSGKELCRVL